MFTNKVAGPMIFYLITLGAGIIFLTSPPGSFLRVGVYPSLYLVWGVFYLLGALVGIISVLLKKYTQLNIKAGVYFELAGLVLIATAHIIYAYALISLSYIFTELSVTAVALLVTGFAWWLFMNAYALIRRIKKTEEIQESINE